MKEQSYRKAIFQITGQIRQPVKLKDESSSNRYIADIVRHTIQWIGELPIDGLVCGKVDIRRG
jgi:hypothetical protein